MDTIQRFLFKDLDIRGQHLKIDQAWSKMTENRGYPDSIIALLGELTAIAIMMANGMKHQGKVTLQVQGQGPINLLVVEVTHDLKLRGVAKTNQTITSESTMDELLGDGQVMVTMENTQTQHHFQSFVPREGDSIAEVFETFFNQSEQLATRLWLGANRDTLAGVMIQKLPGTDHRDEDGWDRVLSLSNTLNTEELCSCESQELLHRLFHEETLELFESKTVMYECPEDKTRVELLLKSMGEEEVRQLLAEQGEIVIHNEICNYHLRFNEEDINQLFKPELNS
ncbi:Hsp33 family molecular chaperone HslO [Thiosulfativibrio zosterae]|uniref:33 kDa chaperonin n=1 Tax=Thiosulfativibrio zosterae TaxID=2675053 RepID=A0A6F8PLQ3_9GAMM|nr:Hsp33 family molecular chaperone HslO [Thiosulfativibrio zosterae]BBP43016.1 33 kDa chaperonin [Thiosulfativibrio zosterae]